jgi:eukaryotic-like serine/threonine-protein kinase
VIVKGRNALGAIAVETSSLGETEKAPEADSVPSLDDRDPVEALADEFIARRRKGETPSLDEYAARCPERAEEIRELFPAIAAMERWKPRPSTPRHRLDGGPIRERIGEYRLIREIGRGGMGIVYEAEQTSLGRKVAIKVLPGMGWGDDRPKRRFLREAKTTAGLRHGNIVPVFAVGHEDDLHYYVMPLILGSGLDRIILELRERKIASLDETDPCDDDVMSVARTLLDRSNAEGSAGLGGASTRSGLEGGSGDPPGGGNSGQSPRRPRRKDVGHRHWDGIAEIGRQAAEALQHAHDGGVLHRDVKPANLLLDADGVVWVADFGLAKAMSDDDLSRTGDLVGTLRYMAPERFKGVCDNRSDIYSLGLTLYELMTLRPAHDVPDRAELIKKIAEAEPTRPRELDPSIPLDLETVVLKAIDPDPRRRYQLAGDLAEDLAKFVDGLPVLARRTALPERLVRWIGRNRGLAVLLSLTFVMTLFSAYFFRLYLLGPPHPRNFPPPRGGVFGPPLGPEDRPRFDPEGRPLPGRDGMPPPPPPPRPDGKRRPGGPRPWGQPGPPPPIQN